MGVAEFTIELADESATRQFGADMAGILSPGDFVALSGPLGAGKTALARAIIRNLANDAALDVPSPSYALVQSYALPRFALLHADLYRANDETELNELDLAADDARVVLMEWADRFPSVVPGEAIAIRLEQGSTPDSRTAVCRATGDAAARLERLLAKRAFLARTGHATTPRKPMAGDASSRSYERLLSPVASVILMNAPRRPDGPPLRNGLPYSRIAHLAEDVAAFAAIDRGLRDAGFSAPEIFAADLAEGFLLIEDLGGDTVVAGAPPLPIADRYAAAIDMLAALHARTMPEQMAVAPDVIHTIPRYDMDAFLIEVELLPDWYMPHFGISLGEHARTEFVDRWHEVLTPIVAGPSTWTLRDFHSPNLIWLAAREGVRRVGLIDFQDCVLGPPAYDVASLAQDARVNVDEKLELQLVARYAAARSANDPAFDRSAFASAYAAMAAQRATKILGIFARLNDRDGKPQYLGHVPRIRAYLGRALRHPTLVNLREWFAAYSPDLVPKD